MDRRDQTGLVRVYPQEDVRSPDKKDSLVEDAYRSLKASILEGTLPAGYTAVEQRIAEQLRMSRTPVHEALIRLQHEGLVKILPRRGVQVVPIHADDLAEVYFILTALEGAAAMLLAEHKGPLPAAIQMMDEATDQMERSFQRQDIQAWARADDHFHRVLIADCGNERLTRLTASLVDQAQRARTNTLLSRPITEDSVAEHRLLISAIKAGDPVGARSAVERHRARASNIILDVLRRPQLEHQTTAR